MSRDRYGPPSAFGSSLKKSKTPKLVWIQNFDCAGNRNVVCSFCNNIFDKQDVLAADSDSQDLNSVFSICQKSLLKLKFMKHAGMGLEFILFNR